MAKAFQRVGEINQALGWHQDAEQAYRRSIRDFDQMAGKFLQIVEYRQSLASCYNNLGNALQAQEKFSEAESA